MMSELIFMNKTEQDGWVVYNFHCERCGWKSNLIINELIYEVTCPRLGCEAIYKHENGDLIFVGYTKNPFFKRRESCPSV